MKTIINVLKVVLAIVIAALVIVLTLTALKPWMDRWGSRPEEISMALPGDELLLEPAGVYTRSITIHASPQQIFAWLVQIGAEKGGWYSYTLLENMVGCKITNSDRIHPEWQLLKPGDKVKMCPGESGPPAYTVAQITPDQTMVMGHKENGKWVNVWMFNLVPQSDGTTRLISRTRTMAVEGFWRIFHPITFVMERGMLMGIRQRAEASQ